MVEILPSLVRSAVTTHSTQKQALSCCTFFHLILPSSLTFSGVLRTLRTMPAEVVILSTASAGPSVLAEINYLN